VVTDSVAQVPPAKERKLGIPTIPFRILIAGREYRDGVSLTAAEVYRRMRAEQALPTPAHPSVGEYAEVFRQCLQRGARGVLYAGLSGALSGSVNAATDAIQMLRTEFPDQTIVVLDTKTAAIPQGFIAMEAARAAALGASLEEVRNRAEGARRRVGFAAILDTLEYLARGGRIGRSASLMGSLLQVKPVVTIETDGIVAPVARPRGNHAALEFIVNFVRERTVGSTELHLAVM
jgi:DegV family protein with EDD domain